MKTQPFIQDFVLDEDDIHKVDIVLSNNSSSYNNNGEVSVEGIEIDYANGKSDNDQLYFYKHNRLKMRYAIEETNRGLKVLFYFGMLLMGSSFVVVVTIRSIWTYVS